MFRCSSFQSSSGVRLRVSFAMLFAAAVLLVGCADAPEVPAGPDGEPDPVLVLGRDIYGSRCASCHGADGGGGRGKKLSEGNIFESHAEIDTMLTVVAQGKNGMPAYGDVLSDDEIEAVARYIREVLN